MTIDFDSIPSPCFVVDQHALETNLSILDQVQQQTGAKVLLALKAFAMFRVFPLLQKTLHGICASSVDEAILGRETFQREVHTFSPAYSKTDLQTILDVSDHVIFNSFSQWQRFQDLITQYTDRVKFGLRVNPQYSESQTPIYDPCAAHSRLGIKQQTFLHKNLDHISGLHFHTLCEQNSYALARTLLVFEKQFADIIPQMSWINFGGGHHITQQNYDIPHLCQIINNFRNKYDVEVYLEPGEAVALNSGLLVTRVLDIIDNEMNIAILDISVVAHMPDVLEMPYRPEIIGATPANETPYTYRLAGNSCLAGDVVADYSFKHPLKIGDLVIFKDMAHYSMVKTTTFNGMRLPTIALYHDDTLEIVRSFGYEDFKNRLS